MKYKRKLIPVNLMNIPAMESWLTDMAAEGLFLHSFQFVLVRGDGALAQDHLAGIDVVVDGVEGVAVG